MAKAAQLALGDAAVAVTGVSASLAEGELDAAAALAQEIGIRHEVLETDELANPAYVANAPDRCFHCKTELYTQLATLAQRLGVKEIASGTNLDDLGDYRPGLAAAAAYGVRQPLADCEFTKADVRALATAWNLRAADKPASPCLSSRVAYGQTVTPERLRMIDAAEQLVRSLRRFGLPRPLSGRRRRSHRSAERGDRATGETAGKTNARGAVHAARLPRCHSRPGWLSLGQPQRIAAAAPTPTVRIVARSFHRMSIDAPPLVRPAARVVLADSRDRILLLHCEDSTIDVPVLWLTPGGACEAGENSEEAAR